MNILETTLECLQQPKGMDSENVSVQIEVSRTFVTDVDQG